MADKSVSVRVGVSTPGAESLKALNDQLRQMGAQAGQPIPDPTKVVADGVKRTEDAVKRVRDEFGRFVKAGATPVPNPTKPLEEGAKKTEEAVKRVRDEFGRFVKEGATPIPDPTKQMVEGLKYTRDAAGRLRDEFGHFARDPTAGMRSGIDRTKASADALMSRLSALASATAAAAGFRSVTGEAIKFESAIADVAKVLDGGAAEAAKVRGEIERLAKVLPITQQGLAQIAAAGASAGVGVKDLPTYIETVAKAATAFNMTAEETGQAFGNLNSVYKLNQDGLRLLADGINYVGNKSATSERNVINVLERVASLGEVAGISREQILALAGAALPALGNRAEVASTSMEALIGVLAAASTSDKKVKNAFDQMGIDINTFQTRIRKDAIGALTDFKTKVEQFNSVGKMQLMQDLFGKENDTKVLAILSNLDQAQQLMEGLGDKTKYAGGLQEEFNQRAATTENQLQLLKNQLRQASINLGEAFLPAINDVVKALTPLIDGIADFARENPTFVRAVAAGAAALIGMHTGGAALALLLPGLTGMFGSAGAAAAGASSGLAAMAGAATGLARVLGVLPALIVAVATVAPLIYSAFNKRSQINAAVDGTSASLDEAKKGLEGIQKKRREVETYIANLEQGKSATEGQGLFARAKQRFEASMTGVATVDEYRKQLETIKNLEAAAQATVETRLLDQRRSAKETEDILKNYQRIADEAKATGEGVKDYVPAAAAGGGGNGSTTTADDMRRALDTLIKAEIEADRKRLQSQSEVLNAELDASLGKRLISQQKYIDEKERLDLQMLDDERTLLLRTRKNIEDALAVPGIKPDEKDRLLAELKRLDADVDAILDKEKTITIKADLDRAKLAEDIKALKADLARDIAELTGDTLGSTLEQIRQEKERLLNDPRFKDDAELRAQIERRAALKETQATYNEKKRIIDETTAYLQLKEQEYQRQMDAGEISMLERERAIAAARKEAADKLREQIDVMRKLAGTNPAMLPQVAQLEAQWLSLSKTVDKVALSINQAFAGGFVSAVEAALNGTERSLTGFLKRIALAAVQSWQQAAGNQLNSLVMKWLGGTGGVGGMLSQFLGGNWAGGLSKMFGGFFANGGDYPANKFIVVGENGPELLFPGVSGSIASNTALTSAVQSMAGTTRQGGGASVASFAPAAPVFSPIIRIINEDNPQRAREAMDSAEGDTVIRNSMERNVNSLRQLLGIRQ